MGLIASVLTEDATREWLEWRREGIGGSDAAAILGMSPFGTAMTVWLDKIGALPLESEDDDSARAERMLWGHLLEPAIADEFCRRTGLGVSGTQMRAVHPERAWQRCTLDGLVLASPEDVAVDLDPAPLGILEIKTTGVRDDWGDELPDSWVLQVQHNLAVTGMPKAWLAVLRTFPSIRLVVHELERDQDLIDSLTAIEEAFWVSNVLARVAPPADGSEVTGGALREAFSASISASTVELDPQAAELIADHEAAVVAAKGAQLRAEAAKNALLAMLGEHEVGLLGGRPAVTWKSVEAIRFDEKSFRALHPELAQQFMRTTRYRRFAIPKTKEES